MTGSGRTYISAWVIAGAMSATTLLGAGGAQAQSIFCPTALPSVDPGNGPFALSGGRCTNGNNGTGAFSGAALGSQSLSDLASGSTETTNRAASGTVQDRRQAEQQSRSQPSPRADEEQVPRRTAERVSRQPSAGGAPRRRMVTETRMVKRGNRMVRTRVLVPAPTYVETAIAPYFIPINPTMRMGTFAQGFGDYEERRGRSASSLTYQAGNVTVPLSIDTRSRSTLAGMLGGFDFTTRGLLSAEDGLILGVLGGYIENDVRVTSRILSSDTTTVGNGSSVLNARATGGSVGAFATYFNGPLSLDALYKVDFLNLSERFVDDAAFTRNILINSAFGGNPPTNSIVSGAGSTSLRSHSIVANFNYRIPLYGTMWMEPTAGLQARWIDYGTSAAQLGLADGHAFRLQAGSRFGWDLDYGSVRITPIVTGLAYSDVSVRGGFVEFSQNGGFGTTTTPLGVAGTSVINLRQEGLLRGQGILTLVGDFGNGMTAFVQGDVRGGKDVFGAGGKAGLRYQW